MSRGPGRADPDNYGPTFRRAASRRGRAPSGFIVFLAVCLVAVVGVVWLRNGSNSALGNPSNTHTTPAGGNGTGAPSGGSASGTPAGANPIKHVIFMIKENR